MAIDFVRRDGKYQVTKPIRDSLVFAIQNVCDDPALAALPGGSTNVFARTIGLPDDPVDAAHLAYLANY